MKQQITQIVEIDFDAATPEEVLERAKAIKGIE